jgi:hypothetical protein
MISTSIILIMILSLTLIGCDKIGSSINKLNPELLSDINSVSINADTLKTKYYVGETLKTIELVVGHKDSTVSFDTVSYKNVIGFDTSTPGDRIMQVAYKGFLIDVPISVSIRNFETIEDVIILKNSTPTEYLVQEEFKGAKIRIFSGEFALDIDVDSSMLIGFSTKEVGIFPVTIDYYGNYAQFSIIVINPVVELSNYMPVYEYKRDAEYIPHKLYIKKKVGEELIDIDISMLDGFDTTTLGKKKITVSYMGHYTTYEILVTDFDPIT